MDPITGAVILGGVLYLVFGGKKKPPASVENVEPKESLLPEREVSKLRRQLKQALKKEKDSSVRTTTPEKKDQNKP